MIKILDKENCTGCGLCSKVCPKGCISMEQDSEGFYYPKVDEKKCINCGLCEKKCPLLDKERKSNNKERPIVVAAWSKEENIRLDSTSGGVFTELAKRDFRTGWLYVWSSL